MTDTFRKTYSTDIELKGFANEVKSVAEKLEKYINLINPGRERSIALTKLEECVMWAIKAIYISGDNK